MSFSPSGLLRSTSPDFFLPNSHKELMSLYKSWNTFSPRMRSRTYKRDAASLIVSWIQCKIKKSLWRWRLNTTRTQSSKIDISLRVKQPSAFIQRRVYLELQVNRNLIKRTIVQNNKSCSRLGAGKREEQKKLLQKYRTKLTVVQEIEQKRKSLEKLRKIMKFLITKQFLSTFYVFLYAFRKEFVAFKLKRCLVRRLKKKLVGFFSELRAVNVCNTIQMFSVFSRRVDRNLEKTDSIDFSPQENMAPIMVSKESQINKTDSSSFLEFSTNDCQSKQLNLDLSPIPWGNKMTMYSNENLAKFSITLMKIVNDCKRSAIGDMDWVCKMHSKLNLLNSKLNSLTKRFKTSTFRLIRNKSSGKRLKDTLMSLASSRKRLALRSIKKVNILTQKLTKTCKIFQNSSRFILQKFLYKLRPIKTKKEKSGPSPLALLAFALKMHISTYIKSIFSEIHEHSYTVHILQVEKRSQKLVQISKLLKTKLFNRKQKFFKKILKNLKNFEFFASAIKTSDSHRRQHLKTSIFRTWKNLKKLKMNLCRGFELLGQFVWSKRLEFFNSLNSPHPVSFYTSSRFRTLSGLCKLLYCKRFRGLQSRFTQWNQIRMYVKILRFCLTINKAQVLVLLDSWHEIGSKVSSKGNKN